MKLSEVAMQALRTALEQQVHIVITPTLFGSNPTSIAVALYDIKRNNAEFDGLVVSRTRDKVLLKHKRLFDVDFRELSPEAFNKSKEVANGSVQEVTPFASNVIRIDGKKKLTSNDLLALRQLLDSTIVVAVEIHGLDKEFFDAVFPNHAFSLHDKKGFLLLL